LFDVDRHRFKQNLDPVFAQNRDHFVGDIVVLVGQQMSPVLDNAHLTTKATKHLPKLQTHIPSTDDL
jgi:hypothetical protein